MERSITPPYLYPRTRCGGRRIFWAITLTFGTLLLASPVEPEADEHLSGFAEAGVVRREPAPTRNPTRALAGYGKLPLRFKANRGQTDRRVKFLFRGEGHTLFLTSTEVVLDLHKPIFDFNGILCRQGGLRDRGRDSRHCRWPAAGHAEEAVLA